MTSDQLAALSTLAAAVAGAAALAVAWLSFQMSKAAEAARRVHAAHELDAAVTARLEGLYPGMRVALGSVDDGIPPEVREVIVPFFVLFSDAWKAHNDDLISERDWAGLGAEFCYWAQKPVAREAWRALRQQTWSDGFADHVDRILAGPPAYPGLKEAGVTTPPTMAEAAARLRATAGEVRDRRADPRSPG